MSSEPRLANLATELVRREEVAIDPPSAEVEARITAALASAIEADGRKHKVRRVGALALAAAASVALFFGAHAWLTHRSAAGATSAAPPVPIAARVTVTGHAVAGGVVLLHDGKEISLDGGNAIFAGDRVIASADGRAAVSLSTGSHLIVESGADMSVVEQDAAQIFDLRTGSIRADVAKLAANERFVVRTPDAEVEVRGTSFRVAVVSADACSAATVTRVYVSEGTVVVRSSLGEAHVTAGTSWPSACAQQADVAPTPSAATVKPIEAKRPTMPTPMATPASELAEQNRLYGAATAAKRKGDAANALALYQDFSAKYPASWLAESAAVERMRILASEDQGRARDAARAYLIRYPHGFARDEANEILGP
jgi:hypothetical protein